MSDTTQEEPPQPDRRDSAQEPSTDQLEEPSTEKEPGEEPKAEKPHDPDPDHQAVGIGVPGGPQSVAAENESTVNGGDEGGAGGT